MLAVSDRLSLDLPGRQPDLIKALARRAPGLPLVVVLVHGGGLDVGWMQEVPAVRAILSVPFPGQVQEQRPQFLGRAGRMRQGSGCSALCAAAVLPQPAQRPFTEANGNKILTVLVPSPGL